MPLAVVAVMAVPCRARWPSASLVPSWPADVGQVHVDDLVHVADVAVPSGFVGELLGDEAGDEGGSDLQVCFPGEAGPLEAPGGPVKHLPGQRVGLTGGFEARDGALEQQLVADRILDAEPGEHGGVPAQRLDRVRWLGLL